MFAKKSYSTPKKSFWTSKSYGTKKSFWFSKTTKSKSKSPFMKKTKNVGWWMWCGC